MNSTARKSNGVQLKDHEWTAPIEDHCWASPSEKAQGTKLRVVPTRLSAYEQEVRMEELHERLQDLSAASHLIWLKNGLDTQDPILDLRTKVESVRWMIRIAKHLRATAREMLFATIRKSLDQIERTVQLGVDAAEASHTPRYSIHA